METQIKEPAYLERVTCCNFGDTREIFDEIEISSVMENLWKAYQKNYYYAANISWQMVMQSIRFLYEISYNDNERTIIHE